MLRRHVLLILLMMLYGTCGLIIVIDSKPRNPATLAGLSELFVKSIEVQVDHENKEFCVGAVIRNDGGSDVLGPFKVLIGISRWHTPIGPEEYKEEIIEVPRGITIPKNGGEYITICSPQELVYRNEDPYAVYRIEIQADFDNQIVEFDDWGNNGYDTEWWSISKTERTNLAGKQNLFDFKN